MEKIFNTLPIQRIQVVGQEFLYSVIMQMQLPLVSIQLELEIIIIFG